MSAATAADSNDAKPDDCDCGDFYSFRITVVVDGSNPLADDPKFRQFAENTFGQEAPAHVLLKICWVSKDDLTAFVSAYDALLGALKLYQRPLADLAGSDAANGYYTALTAFSKVFCKLRNVYAEEKLVDPLKSQQTSSAYPVILGRSGLHDQNQGSNK
jgi:hypothetical protein